MVYTMTPAGFYARIGGTSSTYSDGDDAEERILRVVKTATSCATSSDNLMHAITDWPSEYHFSRNRQALIYPLNIQPHHAVLELGCGCGAITRFLGETGAMVVAVEGSFRRAEIAATRCADLSNVDIYADNILDFCIDKRFDFVIMVGVLEYSANYTAANIDGPNAFIRKARLHLTESGKLAIAIENALGLKYFNWCTEDHTCNHFTAINNGYPGTGVITFGKRELEQLVAAHGFAHTRFYFPYPDYKLPSIVVDERALGSDLINVAAMTAHCISRDYSGVEPRLFSEHQALDVLERNGLAADTANSFLLVASSNLETQNEAEPLAWSFAFGRRLANFCVTTTFDRQAGRDAIIVRKARTYSGHVDAVAVGDLIVLHSVGSTTYIRGKSFLSLLDRSAQSEACLDDFVDALQPWINWLLQHSNISDENRCAETILLPGSLIDAIPQNFIVDETGSLIFIDQEWSIDGLICLGWVLCRGIVNSLSGRLVGQELHRSSIGVVLTSALAKIGVSIGPEQFPAWSILENDLTICVTGRKIKPADESFQAFKWDAGFNTKRRIEDLIQSYERSIDLLRSCMAEAKKALSDPEDC